MNFKCAILSAVMLCLSVRLASGFGAASADPSKAVPWGNSKKYDSDADQCFCQLEGQVDDCMCSVDTVDHFNNMKVFPRLMSLLSKDYFRYFQYNAKKPCPFWDMSLGKCASKNCAVQECQRNELPPGLKGEAVETGHTVVVENKYTEEAQRNPSSCANLEAHHPTSKKGENGDLVYIDNSVDGTISDETLRDIEAWRDHDDAESGFVCDVAQDQCPDCTYVDLSLNPERYTGYSGEASRMIWRAIYEENCFPPPNTPAGKREFSAAFLQDKLGDMCLEKRAFYRAVSGLHTSITIHLCANYLLQTDPASPFASSRFGSSDSWGPNLEEFTKRFDPELTNDQGPYWLKNLYFVYLLELRALAKAAPYLEKQSFFTGNREEDSETVIAVKELMNLVRSFPDHFDETVMFSGGPDKEQLKEDFRAHFHNITRVMDCVGCDKCKLWGKLQITGLGTALKILFSDQMALDSDDYLSTSAKEEKPVEENLQLSRNEIVALFNAFGRISTSIQQLERFREMMR